MKKLLCILITVTILFFNAIPAFASEYTVNPFYAIKSYPEYEKVQSILGDSNDVYYGWSRIARDSNGNMVFTNKISNISKYDFNAEYFLPETINGNLTNQINKSLHPNSKNMLMVFFSSIDYDDGRTSIVDFLNMNSSDWDRNIISPMLNMVNTYGFDGIALDFEGFINSYKGTGYTDLQKSNLRDKYTNFLAQLKNRMQNKKLTICVNLPEYYDGYDFGFIYNTADYTILLDYPFGHYSTYSESDGVPSLVGKIKDIDTPEAQPFDRVKSGLDSIVNILKQKYGASFNTKKLILGTTLEINGWVKKELVYNGKTYTYYEGMGSLPKDSKYRAGSLAELEQIQGTVEYLNQSKTYNYQSMVYKKTVTNNLEPGIKSIEYYYDTTDSLYDKYYRLVHDYKLSGISVWRLGLGNNNTVWSSLNTMFNVPDGDYDELPAKVDVLQDKVWTIKFNMALNKDTVKPAMTNIYVLNSEGKPVDIKLTYEETTNSVKAAPVSNYISGQVYYLIIGKDMKSSNGGFIAKPLRMKFRVK